MVVRVAFATDVGSESMARQACEHGCEARLAADLHDRAVRRFFPRIVQVFDSAAFSVRVAQQRRDAASMRTSAYLTIFDDWEMLGPALASIYDRVEEIVVVDGAYRWMAPMFVAMDRNPAVSCAEVWSALAPFAPKLRIVTGVWEHEVEKRAAGFAACRERYVLRIDADEVLFFDDAELERFAASDKGVAWMRMPMYLAPGLIRGRPDREVETQCFLFDRERIAPVEHCAYLWLELTNAERDLLPPSRGLRMIHRPVVAFNAHLTQWRTPKTALHRARFYVLNYMRKHRDTVNLPIEAIPVGLDDAAWCAALFDRISPEIYTKLLLGRDISVGWTTLHDFGVVPSPLTPEQERGFVGQFATQLAALTKSNEAMIREPRLLRTGGLDLLDLSSQAARAALGGGGEIILDFDEPVREANVLRCWLSATPPHHHEAPVAVLIEGNRLRLDVPPEPPEGSFRCVMSLKAWTESDGPFVSFLARP